jgi:coenzyme F420-0:L-glutamate ligase/NADPH-dependent F420 reductase
MGLRTGARSGVGELGGLAISRFSVIGGTGALGKALAIRLASAGHEVWIGSRAAEKAEAAAREVAEIAGREVRGAAYADAAAASDICFLAVPYAAQVDTVAAVRDAVQGKIVVDTTAPLKPPKVGTVQLPAAGSAAVETAQALGPDVRVVSALQTIGAEKLAAGGAIDADVLVTGDDNEAVEQVRAVLGEIGLRSWHAGPLANSAASEALTSIMIQLNRRYKLGQAGIKVAAEKMKGVSVQPVLGLPMFAAGDDLAQAIGDALLAANERLKAGDVVVVAQKVVSKCEDRVVPLSSVTPRERAREMAAASEKDPAACELMLREASEVMRAAPGVVITRHRTGHVLANAGLDASNVLAEHGEVLLLWPHDPDASARALRTALEARFGVRLGVVVSDSLGRAWRLGTTGHAIGVAGLKPLRDRRGESDLFGRELQATLIGVADEIAAAASLVMGEAAEGIPAAVVRGAAYVADEAAGVGEMLRPVEQDLFR